MRILCVLLGACALGCAPLEPLLAPLRDSASLGGRVVAETGALSVADLSRSVVYLEPIGAPPPHARRPRSRAAPPLRTLRPGPRRRRAGRSGLARQRRHDLPRRLLLLAAERLRPRRLRTRRAPCGPLRACRSGATPLPDPLGRSRASSSWSPTRFVAGPRASGVYEIRGAPPGATGSRRGPMDFPEVAYDVTLRPGEAAFRDIVLGSGASD